MVKRLKPVPSQQPQQQSPPQKAEEPSSKRTSSWVPAPLERLEDTGLTKVAVSDLVLKTLYFRGDMTGHQISDATKLPYTKVLDGVIDFLKHEKLLDILGAGRYW